MPYLYIGISLHLFNACADNVSRHFSAVKCGTMAYSLPGKLQMMRCMCFCNDSSDKGVLITPWIPHFEENEAFYSRLLKHFTELFINVTKECCLCPAASHEQSRRQNLVPAWNDETFVRQKYSVLKETLIISEVSVLLQLVPTLISPRHVSTCSSLCTCILSITRVGQSEDHVRGVCIKL